MISIVVSTFAPMAVVGCAFAIFYCVVEFLRWRHRQTARRSPLNRDHLRAPGETLRGEHEESIFDGILWFLIALVVPLMLYAGYLTAAYFFEAPNTLTRIGVTVAAGLGVILFSLWRFLSIIDKIRRIGHGMAAERATGEELNQLLLDGCRVFHDIKVDYGNIDHVVVAPTGVFAVETKSRGKPPREDSYTVVVNFKSNTLMFPDYYGRIDTDQLESHRRWLAQLVRELCGVDVPVVSVLALPGWKVERKGTGDFLVLNPRNPQAFLLGKRPRVVSDAQIRQIARALEDRVRNVLPFGSRSGK